MHSPLSCSNPQEAALNASSTLRPRLRAPSPAAPAARQRNDPAKATPRRPMAVVLGPGGPALKTTPIRGAPLPPPARSAPPTPAVLAKSILLPRALPPAMTPVTDAQREEWRREALVAERRVKYEMDQILKAHGPPLPDAEQARREEEHVSKFKLPLELEIQIPPDALPWYSRLRELADNRDLQEFYYLTTVRDHHTDDAYRYPG